MKRATNALIALFVAGAGFERLNLLEGRADFSVPPAVLLAPVVLLALAVDLTRRREPQAERPAGAVPDARRARTGTVLLAAFLLLACLSALFAEPQGLSARRVVLLALLIAGGAAVVVLAARTGASGALRAGAWIGLLLTLVIDGLQVWTWLTDGPGVPAIFGPLDLTSPTYGLFAPRPAGLSIDPNRGAFLISLFYVLLALDPWTARRLTAARFVVLTLVAGAEVLVTFSRSGLVVLAVVVLVAVRRRFGVGRTVLALVAGGAAVVAAVVLSLGAAQSGGSVDIGALLDERADFSGDESGGIHFELFAVAYRALAADPAALLHGIGFGNSPSVLQSVFGDTPAANFHSFFLTSLIELGVGGLLVALALLLGGLASSRLVLAAVTCGFNVLYQADLDGSFWLVVALLWLAPAAAVTHDRASPALDGALRVAGSRTPASVPR